MEKELKLRKLENFFSSIFNDIQEGEYIRVIEKDRQGQVKTHLFKTVQELVYCYDTVFSLDTHKDYYFNLATVNGVGASGKTDSLKYAYCIGLDYDKSKIEGLTPKYIVEQFNKLNLKYHAIVDSGNGYHVYTFIEKTDNFDKVKEVADCIAYKTKADMKATLKTQVLRIPFTFNNKDTATKHVNLYHCYDKDKVLRQKLDYLAKKQITEKYKLEKSANIDFEKFNNCKIRPCTLELLENGTCEGNRQEALQQIVIDLRENGYSFEEIVAKVKEFNGKCVPPRATRELEYQIQYVYDNVKIFEYRCKFCKADMKRYCYSNYEKTEFQFSTLDTTQKLKMNEKHMKLIEHKKGKRGLEMDGNNLVVYSLLMVHCDTKMSVNDLLSVMDYKGKRVMSEKTLRETLKELVKMDVVESEKVGATTYYTFKKVKAKIEYTYLVSASALMEVIKGFITPSEFKVYNYLRYVNNKQQREGIGLKNGNLVRIEQNEIADKLNITQGRVSQIIDKLVEEKLMSIYETKKSSSNEFDYYIYRLYY